MSRSTESQGVFAVLLLSATTPYSNPTCPWVLFLLVGFRLSHTHTLPNTLLSHPLRCLALPLDASGGVIFVSIFLYPFHVSSLFPLCSHPCVEFQLAHCWALFCVSGAASHRPVNQVVTRWRGALQNPIRRQASMQISGPFQGCCQQGNLLGGEDHLVV